MAVRRSAATALFVSMGFALAECLAASPQRINAFETLTPSSGYTRQWTSAEAKQDLSGYTFLRNFPGKANEVTYFAPGGIAYQWMSGQPVVASGTWVIDMRSPRSSESAKVFVCTTFNNRSKFTGEVLPGCVDPSLYFIPAAERAKGDVFSIAGRSEAPSDLTIERIRIEDIRRSLATRS